ncbi:hypothetical protein KO465_04520 [Candidatus Micrarchaeota archaeon]|jgi:RNA polymerase sigma factor (sigma-70 family)|nr:hypothetical protein [Candidatus Micrarchaeota archaeon]
MGQSDAEITMYLVISLRRFAARKAFQYRNRKQRELLLFDAPVGGRGSDDKQIWSKLVLIEEGVEERVIRNALVKQILLSLTSREKDVIKEIFLLERTETQIAQKLGIRQQRVNQLKKQALSRMRAELVRMGFTA